MEALTAVIEPYPIAYLIDFLQGATADVCATMGWPALCASAFLETIALLTVGIIGLAAVNSAADSLAEICLARGGRTASGTTSGSRCTPTCSGCRWPTTTSGAPATC